MKLKRNFLIVMVIISWIAYGPLYAMDAIYQMPSVQVLYTRLISGQTCFDEQDNEPCNLATVLGNKKLSFAEIESAVNYSLKRHVDYLARELADMEPDAALMRVTPQWKEKVLAVILQDQKFFLKKMI